MKHPILFSPLAIIAALLLANTTLCTTASAQIITTNLNLWLTSGTGVTTDISGNVSSWADQSGSGYNAVQATAGSRPAYVTTGTAATTPTGQASVSFDGSNDFLLGSMGSLTYADIFVVGRLNSANTGANTGIMSMTGGDLDVYANAALVWASGYDAGVPTGADARWDGGGYPSIYNMTLALNQWYVYEYRVTDAGGGNVTASIYYRGLSDGSFVQLATVTFPASSTVNLTQYALGSRLFPTPNYFSDVDIASVLVYDGALTTGDETQVRNTLYNQFISVPEPGSMLLAGLGLGVVFLYARRSRQREA